MKTKIYFNDTLKNSFIDYAMEIARGLTDYNSHILNYFTPEKIEKITDYFISRKNTFCNNKGEYWELGELHTETPTQVYIAVTDQKLTDRKEILNYMQKEFNESLSNFIEEHLYNNLFCEIERLLRCEYQNTLSDYDKRFLQRAYKA